MPTFSDLAVSMLMSRDSRIKKGRFRATVREWIKDMELTDEDEILESLSFRPDAFMIDETEQAIVCYEVEDTHPISRDKLSVLTTAWQVLDFSSLDLRVIVLDRYGQNAREIDLGEYYIKLLYSGAYD